ncbi:MAG: hypothetical protein CVU65_12310 [Deltaproteobacteria bacterium HGW-Deltaproteobacteria-22]|jgi:hypothetical protein|nr:MAG: hypothetical protein CVU65_12310 [Deltaproteobacteria bacterium HGW-Deltaproteobacteria-22]
MPRPLAICIENCYPPHESLRYLRCCAITGVDPGLAVTPGGEVVWKSDGPSLCEIWVSSDEKLICFRPPGAPAGARIHRAGREVTLEENKPVVVISGDYLLLPGHCYRIHVHGEASEVTGPRFLDFEEPASSTWARFAVAGALVLGTVVVPACSRPPAEGTKPVEVRAEPPSVEPVRKGEPESPPPDDLEELDEPSEVMTPKDPGPPAKPVPPSDKSDAGVPPGEDGNNAMKPIEVRPVPPSVPAPRKPVPPPKPPGT